MLDALVSGSSRLLRDNTAFERHTNSSETGIWLKALIPLVCAAGSSADTLADFLISSSPAGRRNSAKTAAVLSFLKDLPPLVQPVLLSTAASKGDGTESLAGELTARTPARQCILRAGMVRKHMQAMHICCIEFNSEMSKAPGGLSKGEADPSS